MQLDSTITTGRWRNLRAHPTPRKRNDSSPLIFIVLSNVDDQFFSEDSKGNTSRRA